MNNKFKLLYQHEYLNAVEKKVLPLLKDINFEPIEVEEYKRSEDKSGPLILFLTDHTIKEIFSILQENKVSFTVLPHYKATNMCAGLGVSSNLKKAVEFFKKQSEPVALDIIHCNGRPVFNNILIGDTLQLVTNKSITQINPIKRFFNTAKKFLSLRPFPIELELKNEQKVKTLASGIIIVQHRQSSLLARLIPGDSFIREGMFHAFILSPRSILELIKYSLFSFIIKDYFPPFGAHIKTEKMKFICPKGRELTFTEDGEPYKEETLELEIKKSSVKVFPGEELNLSSESRESNEIYKTSSLPSPEVSEELSSKSLPIIRNATTDEFKDLFQVLRENAQLKSSYLILMILSTALATFGLFANSTPVVIGAMILAPLMSPIITLSMATLRQDKKLIIQSGQTILIGMMLAFIAAVLLTWITPITTPNNEILSRVKPTLLDLGVAVISGIAGAYAHAREEVAKTLAGVAISVALVPPLSVSAIGLGWGDFNIFWGAALLLLTNLAGMVLAGALTFLVLGFSPLRLATKGVLISLMTVSILSIPLAIGFNHMVYEHQLIQKLDGLQKNEATITEVKVHRHKPLNIEIRLSSQKPLNTNDIDQLKVYIEQKLDQKVNLEINTIITR